jgi:hypothetical protein
MTRVVPCLVAAAIVLVPAGRVSGQTVPVVDRPLVVEEGSGEVSFTLSVGLDESAGGVELAGRRVQLRDEWIGDRHGGLAFAYGVARNVEVGAAVQMGWRSPDYAASALPRVDEFRTTGDGFKFLGAYVWTGWAFMPFLGLEFGIRVPGEQFNYHRIKFEAGLPFKWVFSPGLLALHVRPDLFVGIAKAEHPDSKDQDVQVGMLVDAGITLNLTPELFFDVSAAVECKLNNAVESQNRVAIPMQILAGYTVIPALDLSVAYVLSDLYNVDGAAAASALTIGAKVRF